jgi:6-phosphogluconate dehydrogenase
MKKIGIIGLGKMGNGIGYRLVKAGFQVFGYDLDTQNCKNASEQGIILCQSNQEVAQKSDVIWLLVPAGKLIDTIIESIQSFCINKIIIDAGNSLFSDSIKRYHALQKQNISFVDCGTSGGVHGKKNGFCLMTGGNKESFEQLKDQYKAIACVDGYAYIGAPGAGHYVKMIHNGIEYALMQAYAEGLHLIHKGQFKNESLDLSQITNLWNNGSVIRSWLLELTHSIFEQQGQTLESISGSVKESGMGLWTIQEAEKYGIPVTLIKDAFDIRKESQISGGNYGTKLVALMRNQFGGHTFETKGNHENS